MKFWGIEMSKKQVKICKKVLKGHAKAARPTPSLQDEPRYTYKTDDYDSDLIEYGFLSHRTDLTDEEIQEMVDDMRLVICSWYDCTGQRFTQWITTHRNPSGLVSYVHCMGLDV